MKDSELTVYPACPRPFEHKRRPTMQTREDTSMTNEDFARLNHRFRTACELEGIEPTRRQASKWRRKTGRAHKQLGFNKRKLGEQKQQEERVFYHSSLTPVSTHDENGESLSIDEIKKLEHEKQTHLDAIQLRINQLNQLISTLERLA